MIQSVIPCSSVGDPEKVNRIRKLAEYVARNGPEFEVKVKEKESDNVLFSFLDPLVDNPGNQLYSWHLFCAKHFYTTEQTENIEAQHCTRIRPASLTGCIELSSEDYLSYMSLLAKNTGSKEFIKEIRNWFISRSHSASAISFLIIDHMKGLSNTFATNQDPGLFKSMLHTVYAINDIMFNSAVATSEGPYTRILGEFGSVDIASCLMPQLPHILYLAYKSATVDGEREKIVRVVNIWVTRLFIDQANGDALIAAMKSDAIGGILPFKPVFQSPFPQNLPPPNPSPQQQQQQQQHLIQQQQQQQQQHSNPYSQPSMMHIAPSLFPGSAMPPQMPVFRPPPSFSFGPGPGVPPGVPPPQFQYPPPAIHLLPSSFASPPSSSIALQPQQYQQQQQQQQQPSQFSSFPQQPFIQPPGFPVYYPAPVPLPVMLVAANTPVLDLHRISVGTMANLVKAAIKGGHPRYVPLDGTTIAHVVPPYVEPGRLEARVSEYYRKLEIALGGAPPKAEVPFDAYAAFMSAGSVGGGGGGSSGASAIEDQDRSPRGGMYSGEAARAASLPAPALTEDNEGHKLLKRMGWNEGSGLGAEGDGIVEPIRETIKKDKTGIGSGGVSGPVTEFSSYRQQLSSEYHARIGPDHRGPQPLP